MAPICFTSWSTGATTWPIALGQALLSLALWLRARTARTRGESLPGADTLPQGKK
ncbi:MAG: hypothetical protein ABIG94_05845 [Pseudomonadota bacterium]